MNQDLTPGRALYLLEVPTPQRTPTLDELARTGKPLILAAYLTSGDQTRGWGDVRTSHPSVLLPHGLVQRGLEVWRLVACPSTRIVAIFGYGHWEFILAFCAARLLRRPIVTRSDSNIRDLVEQRRVKLGLKRSTLRVLIGRATKVWTIGSSNAAYWTELGFRNQEMIPYEVPALPGGTREKAAELRDATGASDETRVLLFVGRLTPDIKGLEDLLIAYRQVLESPGPPVQLWIVGAGPMKPHLEQACAALGGARLFGSCEYNSLGSFFIACDAVVVPSRSEPWGLVVNEALGFGQPVIASDRVGAADDLIDESNGLRFRAGDPAALADAIRRLLELQLRPNPRTPMTNTATMMGESLGRMIADHTQPGAS